jgi:hypothetical protein
LEDYAKTLSHKEFQPDYIGVASIRTNLNTSTTTPNDLIVINYRQTQNFSEFEKLELHMNYQIIPLEMGSIAERHIFQRENKEIKCGMIWKLGSVLTSIKPKFIKAYDPNLGICIEDIHGGVMGKTYGEEKVIYFSATVEEDEQDELSDIFYGSSKKYSNHYVDVYEDLGWIQIGSKSYIFGELEIIEINKTPEIYK